MVGMEFVTAFLDFQQLVNNICEDKVMGDLIFYYGPMGCSKSANALMLWHNEAKYHKKNVWLIKSEVDTRDDISKTDDTRQPIIKSRIGIYAEATAIGRFDHINPPADTQVIICDEAQFLEAFQIDELKIYAKKNNVNVFCFGLRTDFQTKLFNGSKRLFEIADRLIEMETSCACGEKAIVNARFNNGMIVSEGDQILIGGDMLYKAMCYSCWDALINNHQSSN